MYVDPEDHKAARVMFDNLVGLMYIRNFGDADDLNQLIRLSDHFAALGRPLPVYALTVENARELTKWNSEYPIDLFDSDYNLSIVHLPVHPPSPSSEGRRHHTSDDH